MIPQSINTSKDVQWDFYSQYTIKEPNGEWKTTVTYKAYDASGNVVDSKIISYTGKSYNNFWKSFNSGIFLLEELVKELGITYEIPVEAEDSFLNEVPEEIEEKLNKDGEEEK